MRRWWLVFVAALAMSDSSGREFISRPEPVIIIVE
jgi:hypothetical protein